MLILKAAGLDPSRRAALAGISIRLVWVFGCCAAGCHKYRHTANKMLSLSLITQAPVGLAPATIGEAFTMRQIKPKRRPQTPALAVAMRRRVEVEIGALT